MGTRSRVAFFALGVIALATPAGAWDYPGHRIVGAVADLVLQQHHPATWSRVRELLEKKLPGGVVENRTLRDVAVFPDCAKPRNEPYCGRPSSPEEKDYVARNRNHDRYHYTDVPLQQPAYVAGSAGTGPTDVVKMIDHAVAQLSGKPLPAKAGVELTDSEAVWLLAHLLGDIHQPLHVGAKYFGNDCETSVDPNLAPGAAETRGGNLIYLVAPAPAVPPAQSLHLYWDGQAVSQAMRAAGLANAEQDFARLLAAAPPVGWQTAGAPGTWATRWATEILPLAAAAHDRLAIRNRGKSPPVTGVHKECTWETTLDAAYEDFARQHARIQLAKAGFRLAALLKAIFDP